MPRVPKTFDAKFDGIQILNAIRHAASTTYQERIPVATQDNIAEVGNAMMQYEATQNEFLHMLVNRIARVIITSKSYSNPLKPFKRGVLANGEAIEEVFVNMATAKPFDPILAERTVFKREIPDVSAVFHKINSRVFYKTTVSREQLAAAFLSAEGITDLVSKIVDSLYSGAELDEYISMREMFSIQAQRGAFYPVYIPALTATNAQSAITTIKQWSNRLEFISASYNPMGVKTRTLKNEQYLFVTPEFDAMMDVNVLAAAFNMNKAEFLGHKIMVDNFGTGMEKVQAILVDRDWFMDFDRLDEYNEIYNPEGLYWNYFYHVWRLYSASPFVNAIMFTSDDTITVTSIDVTPAAPTVKKGDVQQFTATFTASPMAPKGVIWSVTGATQPVKSQIDWTGRLLVAPDEKNTTLTVTATSTYDPTKTDTATVTVAD